MTDRAAVFVQHVGDEVGAHEIAAVCHGADRRDELDGRDGEGLTKGGGGELGAIQRVTEHVVVPPEASRLAGEVNARLVKEAERPRIFIKALRADALPDLDKGDVAGVHDRLCQRFRAVTAAAPAVDRVCPSENVHAPAAVEVRGLAHRARLQGHCQCDDLEGGPRLVGVGNCLVAPHGRALLRQKLVALRLGLRRVHTRLRRAADGQVVVEVKVVEGGHCQHRAGLDIHDDAAGAVLHHIVLHGEREIFFEIILHGRVDGEHHVLAVLRVVVILKIGEQHIRSGGVRGADDAPVNAGERAVKTVFKTGETVIVHADEAYHMAGEARIGVVALGRLLYLHAAQRVFLLEAAHGLHRLVVHLELNGRVP